MNSKLAMSQFIELSKQKPTSENHAGVHLKKSPQSPNLKPTKNLTRFQNRLEGCGSVSTFIDLNGSKR